MALDPYYSLESVKEFGTKRPKGIRTRRRARKTYEYIYPSKATHSIPSYFKRTLTQGLKRDSLVLFWV